MPLWCPEYAGGAPEQWCSAWTTTWSWPSATVTRRVPSCRYDTPTTPSSRYASCSPLPLLSFPSPCSGHWPHLPLQGAGHAMLLLVVPATAAALALLLGLLLCCWLRLCPNPWSTSMLLVAAILYLPWIVAVVPTVPLVMLWLINCLLGWPW
jgi:hypothetical protein